MTTYAQQVVATRHPVAATLATIEDEVNHLFLERREAIRAILLAILANGHFFVLGKPGTGKTDLIREVFGRIVGIKFFEAILAKDRPAEAVVGPYDIPELREHGNMHRKYQGFLPDSDYAFLDEMGKMSPTLGHNVLDILLGRRLHQVGANGRSWIDLSLRSVGAGSNELPTTESDDAAALWDRMDVRIIVDEIRETGNFIKLMNGIPRPSNPTQIDFADLATAVDAVVPAIPIPSDVTDALARLRTELLKSDIEISTRRWMKGRRLMQASAFMEGRTEVSVDDIEVLRFMLWESYEQVSKVQRLTMSVSNPMAEKALALQERANELLRKLNQVDDQASAETKAQMSVELNGNLTTLIGEVSKLKQSALAAGSSTTKIDEVNALVQNVRVRVYKDLLGIDLPVAP